MDDAPLEQTIFSFSEQVPSPPERRLDLRRATAMLTGTLESDRKTELCLVRDISMNGLRACIYSPLDVGGRAAVTLKSGQRLSGTIVWARDEHIGLKFDRPIDVEDALAKATAAARGRVHCLPRIGVNCPTMVSSGDRILRGTSVDISQGGARIELNEELAAGQVIVAIAGLARKKGAIRWSNERYTDVVFEELIPLPHLIDWSKSQWRHPHQTTVETGRAKRNGHWKPTRE